MILPKGDIVQQPRSRFMRVKCLDCEHEQLVFSHATTVVECQSCGKVIGKPTGGKTKLEPIAREVEELA